MIRAVGGGATVFRGFTPYINLLSVLRKEERHEGIEGRKVRTSKGRKEGRNRKKDRKEYIQ